MSHTPIKYFIACNYLSLLYSLEYIEQQSPEFIDSIYLKALVRRVNTAQCWAERDHFELWILLQE